MTVVGLSSVRPAAAGVTLRAHQMEALEAIVRSLTPRPEMPVHLGGLRATVQMATGSGKSFVGAVAGQKLAPRGVVLVVVPTLDLLLQMVDSWRVAGRSGRMYAVCSLIPGALPHGVLGTTNPLQIALWLAGAARDRRPVTLFATYASVGAVADAFQVPAGLLGDRDLDPLDLMVCDEAHRSSGSAEKSWTVVHDQDAIPALRRLYMTATPRIWAQPAFKGREDAFQPLQEDLVCSMDDVGVFGPQVYTLGLQEAIDRGLLAPFEIAVLELRDPGTHKELVRRLPLPWGAGVGESRSEDQVAPERIAAIQAGLIQACVQRKLRRVITFHSRTIEARYFAETLNQTAERLHAENPDEMPPELWSEWLSGEHDAVFRAQAMSGFARAQEDEGLEHAVLANCKVLGEGVDIPEADGVLLQGHGSMVDIVQAIGRALRTVPRKRKVASLIVPVFFRPGEEPGDLLGSDAYGPLVKILTALRSHSARVVEDLAVPQLSGKRSKGRSSIAVQAPGEGEQRGEGAPAFTLPVRFQTPVDANALALFIQVRVLTGENEYWREGIDHARAWHAEHGHLLVPYSTVVGGKIGKAGEPGTFALGRWISDRRGERASGVLLRHRVDQLNQLGMVWRLADAKFEQGLDSARAWAAEHGGSLAVPARAAYGGFALGQWLVGMRAAASIPEGTEGALDPEQRRRLEEIDPWWCPAWPLTWQRSYAVARMWWLANNGVVDWTALPADVEFEGEHLGRWVREQRGAWPELMEEQRELLAAIGIAEDQALAAERAAVVVKLAGRRSQAERFQQGLEALMAFVEREGHARVPRSHRTEEGLALGVWWNNTRARRDKLSEEQLAALEVLGVAW